MPKKPTVASLRDRLAKLDRRTKPGLPVRDFELTNDILALVDPSGDLVAGPFELDSVDDAMRLALAVFGNRPDTLKAAAKAAQDRAHVEGGRADPGAALALALLDVALAALDESEVG